MRGFKVRNRKRDRAIYRKGIRKIKKINTVHLGGKRF